MTSITSLAKFEMCRIVEHTHTTQANCCKSYPWRHIESTSQLQVLQNRAIRTNEYIVQFQMYILYCTDANVCIVSQTKRLEVHRALSFPRLVDLLRETLRQIRYLGQNITNLQNSTFDANVTPGMRKKDIL